MKPIVYLSTLVLALSLTACGNDVKTLEITAVPTKKQELVLPKVDRVSTRQVKWIVITESNVSTVLANLKKTGKGASLFAVTDAGYKAIAANEADVRKLILQQNAKLFAYEQYYVNGN